VGRGGARKYNSGLEGSQAVPARPSGMGNVYNHFLLEGQSAMSRRVNSRRTEYKT
jgi:hypothetical protein